MNHCIKTITYSLLLFLSAANGKLLAQSALLQSGPMLGYADMKEVALWAQTTSEADVHFKYWDQAEPSKVYSTDNVHTEKKSGFTAHCIADQVEPGRTYSYQLYINKKAVKLPYPTTFKTQALWRWRTDPPEFTLAAGSCNYINEERYDRPGTPYGSEYEIFKALAAKKPEAMIWLGDNTYYREPDWFTRTGMLYRYTHTRSLPELQPLLASTANYAIWDDHDYGPNDSDASWVHKDMSWEVFQNFWANPSYGVNGQKGCTTYFQYNDVDVFMLDNRYFRTPNDCASCPRTMLGKDQLNWLFQSLAQSRAPFKIVAVGGQVLSTNDANETFHHLFPAERDSILQFIEREKIKGVVFLTGDRHFAELSQYRNAAGNMVYDLTTSSLTAGVFTDAAKTDNVYRVEGTLAAEHNFALLHFSGPRKARQMEIILCNKNGDKIWSRTLNANE